MNGHSHKHCFGINKLLQATDILYRLYYEAVFCAHWLALVGTNHLLDELPTSQIN